MRIIHSPNFEDLDKLSQIWMIREHCTQCDSKGEERNRVVPRGKIKNIF